MKSRYLFVDAIAAAVLSAITLACPSLARATAEKADDLTQTALNLDANPDGGKLHYEQACARCHGLKGEGVNPDDPVLAGQRYLYLIRQLANFGAAERDDRSTFHVAAQSRLQDQQSWVDVAAYLNKLPTPTTVKTGDGTTTDLGRGIFHEQCASCHRGDASGDKEGFVPSLRNQQYGYLVKQLNRLGAGHRHNVDRNLVLFILSLEDQDVVAVADYLSRRRGVVRTHDRMLDNGVVVN